VSGWHPASLDWEDCSGAGRSLAPSLQPNEVFAAEGVRVLKRLRVPGFPGRPSCAGQALDIICAIFGESDPEAPRRAIC
jgi:hypothetical protein